MNGANGFSSHEEQIQRVILRNISLSPREFLCPQKDFQITLDDFLGSLPALMSNHTLGLAERNLILSQGQTVVRFRKPLLYLTRVGWRQKNCKRSDIWKGTPYLIFPRDADVEVPALVYQCGWVPVQLPRDHVVTRYEHFLAHARTYPTM